MYAGDTKHDLDHVGYRSYTGSPNLSPIDMSFYRHSVVTLVLDCFVSEISLVLYPKCPFCTFVLSSRIWRRSPRVRPMSSLVQWATSLG